MKFPVVSGMKTSVPGKAKCALCRKAGVCEPHSMAILAGGAMLMNATRTEGGPSARMDAWLAINWHGAHDEGRGSNREVEVSVPIAADVVGGQFWVYFCSTKCLRKFLNAWVDELDRRVASDRERHKARRPRTRAFRPVRAQVFSQVASAPGTDPAAPGQPRPGRQKRRSRNGRGRTSRPAGKGVVVNKRTARQGPASTPVGRPRKKKQKKGEAG